MSAGGVFLEEARSALVQAKAELDAEGQRIDKALAALNGDKPKPRRGRPKGSSTAAAPRRRRKRSGTRADQAVRLVEENPEGISASDIAKAMKIKPNYLYRVLGDLEKEGRVRKDSRTYFPIAKASK